jgi:hypothetical protein
VALLRLSLEGKDWEYDPNTMGLVDAIALERSTGMTVGEFIDGLTRGSAVSFQALFWLARKANGEPTLKLSDVDGSFATMLVKADDDEAAEGDGSEVPLDSSTDAVPSSGESVTTSQP